VRAVMSVRRVVRMRARLRRYHVRFEFLISSVFLSFVYTCVFGSLL
jgi:hypothetical protein